MYKRYLFILLILLGLPCAYAAPGDHYIIEILENGAQIKLDDGFVWKVPTAETFFGHVTNDYQAEVRTWMPGDEVKLYFMDIGDRGPRIRYKLYNERAAKQISVFYGQQSEEFTSPHIVSIETKGWRAPCFPYEEKMILSDGSEWLVDRYYAYATAYWQVGDHVAAYRSYSDAFVFLNHDCAERTDYWGLSLYNWSCAYVQPYPEQAKNE